SKISIKRLPWPYQTNCTDYKKYNSMGVSKDECINKCRSNKYIKTCGCLPIINDIAIFKDHGNNNHQFCNNSDKNIVNCILSIKLNCDYCGTECDEEYYELNKKFLYDYMNEGTRTKIRHSVSPDLLFIHSPQMTFIIFLCNIG